jgi:hypothetical protein
LESDLSGVQITEGDVIAASLAQCRLSLTDRKMLLGTGALGLGAVLVNIPYEGQQSSIPWLVSVCAAIWVLSIAYNLVWGIRRIARRQFRELAMYREPFSFQWEKDRLRIEAGASVSDLRWGDLASWYRYDGGYLLYPSSRMYVLVPERALTGEASESALKVGLNAGNVPERRLFAKTPSRAGGEG